MQLIFKKKNALRPYDGLSYLTQQSIKYIPIGDKIELNLGPDPEVIFELIKIRYSRDHLWVQLDGGNRYQQVGGNDVVQVDRTSIAGWDDHAIYSQRIRNYTKQPIDVEIRRTKAAMLSSAAPWSQHPTIIKWCNSRSAFRRPKSPI